MFLQCYSCTAVAFYKAFFILYPKLQKQLISDKSLSSASLALDLELGFLSTLTMCSVLVMSSNVIMLHKLIL